MIINNLKSATKKQNKHSDFSNKALDKRYKMPNFLKEFATKNQSLKSSKSSS